MAAGLAVFVSCLFLRQQREVADADAIASRRDAYGDGISVCEYRNLCVNRSGAFLLVPPGDAATPSPHGTLCRAQLSPYVAEGQPVPWAPQLAPAVAFAGDVAAVWRRSAFVMAPAAYPWKYCHFLLNNVLPLLGAMRALEPQRLGQVLLQHNASETTLNRGGGGVPSRPRLFHWEADLLLHHSGFEALRHGPAAPFDVNEVLGDAARGLGARGPAGGVAGLLGLGLVHALGGAWGLRGGELVFEPRVQLQLPLASDGGAAAITGTKSAEASAVCYRRVVAGVGGAGAHWTPSFGGAGAEGQRRGSAAAPVLDTAALLPALRESALAHCACESDSAKGYEAEVADLSRSAPAPSLPHLPRVALLLREGATEVDVRGARVLRNASRLERVLQRFEAAGEIRYAGSRSLRAATLCEQVCTFSRLSIIVGAHGQELVNVVWMGGGLRGMAVVELAHEGQYWYKDLCRLKGAAHVPLPGVDPSEADFAGALAAAIAAWHEQVQQQQGHRQ